MAKVKNEVRKFNYVSDRKAPFSVETTLTDAEAIKTLGGFMGDSFESKCAFEIHKRSNGFLARDNMVAWGFRLAEEKAHPPEGVKLSKEILSVVGNRRPVKGQTEDGFSFKVSLCGPRSKYEGQYAITDGGDFGDNQFYGYASPSGEWKPRNNTPASVIARLS